MKNVHLIKTDKPSRLFYNVGGALLFRHYENHNGVNIYITSDEEIKDVDYRLNIQRDYFKKSDKEGLDYYNKRNDVFKKIILTTDQDLIKDGVQPIDDEFLEWFVKNPSCEEVEVQDWVDYYKIFIPQEKPKMIECYFVPSNNTSSATKWQEERMYSEEEVFEIIALFVNDAPHNTKEWFEQFKKK